MRELLFTEVDHLTTRVTQLIFETTGLRPQGCLIPKLTVIAIPAAVFPSTCNSVQTLIGTKRSLCLGYKPGFSCPTMKLWPHLKEAS